MKLFALKPTQELIDDHESHFNKLVKTGLVTVIDEITDQFNEGLVFRGTDELSESNSIFYKAQQFTYKYLSGLSLPLFNSDFTVLDQTTFTLPVKEDTFVKPNNKLKAFQPTILKKGESILSLGLSPEVLEGLEVVACTPKDISNVIEVRAIVFDGALCSMAITSHEDKSLKIHADTIKFILKTIRRLPKTTSCVIDVAVHDSKCSLMELNPLETSGFFLEDYKRILELFSRYEIPVKD